jgi:hypothetical protein
MLDVDSSQLRYPQRAGEIEQQDGAVAQSCQIIGNPPQDSSKIGEHERQSAATRRRPPASPRCASPNASPMR